MSSFAPRLPASPFARFEGVKAADPIKVRNRGVLDALIVAALDETVRAILPAEPVTITVDGTAMQHLPDFRLLMAGQEIVIDIQRLSRTGADHGRFEAVAAALAGRGVWYERREPPQVFGTPLLTNARAIWGCRRTAVSAADQVRVLDLLKAWPAPLAEAAQAVRDGDGITAILALACRDVLVLDLLSAPLGPETRVWRRGVPVPLPPSEGGN
ncbi:hypothetical protein KHP60_09690 [Microvirga sp. 3-52]|uniref:hypothetical protein n=1 Tax=Microvirga sp. 3-52 TaxID=2792425 RepID=UPI001ACB5ED8|nr:hypothetical protein [Microvirga sp. 3-52]MBO1905305.1 hypothetical protein [Microvirga sp. 3-52]MBS7452606.1 hypothetical protein [Microvirga sp. 3-52]